MRSSGRQLCNLYLRFQLYRLNKTSWSNSSREFHPIDIRFRSPLLWWMHLNRFYKLNNFYENFQIKWSTKISCIRNVPYVQFYRKFSIFIQKFTNILKIFYFYSKVYKFIENFPFLFKSFQFHWKFSNFIENFAVLLNIFHFYSKDFTSWNFLWKFSAQMINKNFMHT